MKAVLFHQHGGPEVLEYTDFPTPEPKPGEALIRLHAAALNRVDMMVRNGWPGLKLEMPHINGEDGAGEIAVFGPPEGETAEDMGLKVGDHVVIDANLGCGKCEFCLAGKDNMCREWHLLGETVRGTYAEYVALPVKQLYRLPEDFDFHQAAAAALVYQTAWHSLVKRGNLQKDETVLIVGAGGGVNTASLEIAKLIGARVVVIGSSAEKLKMAESLGADVLIDRSKEEDWAKAVFNATSKRGVDVVVDNVGTTFMQSLRALRNYLGIGYGGGINADLFRPGHNDPPHIFQIADTTTDRKRDKNGFRHTVNDINHNIPAIGGSRNIIKYNFIGALFVSTTTWRRVSLPDWPKTMSRPPARARSSRTPSGVPPRAAIPTGLPRPPGCQLSQRRAQQASPVCQSEWDAAV